MIAEHRARGGADDDLVRLRQRLQTRRQVRRLADTVLGPQFDSSVAAALAIPPGPSLPGSQ